MTALYNEIDPLKAETLREAIQAGAIAPGDVDERSITELTADDVMGYTQCHFFAGGGFWSLALRQAGWPDHRPVWTGSCPCPSFSAAGKGGGFDDPRHLWPAWARLIRECKPPVIFGEQSDDAVGYGWLDLVQTDLEAAAYSVGKIVFGAHSVGAPHIRQRLYFCADTASERYDGRGPSEAIRGPFQPERSRAAGQRPNPNGGQASDGDLQRGGKLRLLAKDCGAGEYGVFGNRPDTEHDGHAAADGLREAAEPSQPPQPDSERRPARSGDVGNSQHADSAGPLTRRPAGEAARYRSATDAAGSSGDGGHAAEREQPMRGSAPAHPRHAAQPCELGGSSDADAARHVPGAHRGIYRGEEGAGPRHGEPERYSDAGDHLHPIRAGLEGLSWDEREWRGPGWLTPEEARSVAATGATCGYWAGCDWWYGRDGKYRPAGPGIQPLASRDSPDVVLVCGSGKPYASFKATEARVGRLRLYGDAIVVPAAAEFIKAYMEARNAI